MCWGRRFCRRDPSGRIQLWKFHWSTPQRWWANSVWGVPSGLFYQWIDLFPGMASSTLLLRSRKHCRIGGSGRRSSTWHRLSTGGRAIARRALWDEHWLLPSQKREYIFCLCYRVLRRLGWSHRWGCSSTRCPGRSWDSRFLPCCMWNFQIFSLTIFCYFWGNSKRAQNIQLLAWWMAWWNSSMGRFQWRLVIFQGRFHSISAILPPWFVGPCWSSWRRNRGRRNWAGRGCRWRSISCDASRRSSCTRPWLFCWGYCFHTIDHLWDFDQRGNWGNRISF